MASDKKLYYKRAWLNKPHHGSHAHVLAEVTHHPPNDYDPTSVYASFELMDCTRIASLAFHLGHTKRADANTMFKARLLQQTVNEFVETLEQAHEEMNDG